MALDFLNGIKSALKSIADEKRKLTAKLEELKQQREDAMLLPLPKEDVLRQINEYVDTVSDKYHAAAAEAIKGVAHRPLENDGRSFRFLVRPAGTRDEAVPDFALFALIGPDRIKQALAETVSRMEWKSGLPLSKRKTEIERLDREIADTEAKLRTLIAEAEQAGVRV